MLLYGGGEKMDNNMRDEKEEFEIIAFITLP